MRRALDLAAQGAARGEVPVAAVVVLGGRVIAEAHNRTILDNDPTAHAEVIALRAGGRRTGDWRLEACTLYVTLEPCPMCLEACRQARISLVVWGAPDPTMGACGSVIDPAEDPRLQPPVAHRGGLMAEASQSLLREFFAKRRKSS